jgi:hypothetical protein
LKKAIPVSPAYAKGKGFDFKKSWFVRENPLPAPGTKERAGMLFVSVAPAGRKRGATRVFESFVIFLFMNANKSLSCLG